MEELGKRILEGRAFQKKVVGIPVSQVLSVCLAVGAAAAILIRRKKMRKNTVTQDIVEEKKK